MANQQDPNEHFPPGGNGGGGANNQQRSGGGPRVSFRVVSQGPGGQQISWNFDNTTGSNQQQQHAGEQGGGASRNMMDIFQEVQGLLSQAGVGGVFPPNANQAAGGGRQQQPGVPGMLNMLQNMFTSLTAADGVSGEDINEIAARLFEQQERQYHPTSQEFLDSLEEKKLTREDLERNPSDAITFEEFQEGDKAVKLPCGHAFRKEGLVQWLKDNNNCPVCRETLPEEQESNRRQRQTQQQDEDALLDSVLNETLGNSGAAVNPGTQPAPQDNEEDVESLVRESLQGLSDRDLRDQCVREGIQVPEGCSREYLTNTLVRYIAHNEQPDEGHQQSDTVSHTDNQQSVHTRWRTVVDFLNDNPVPEEPSGADEDAYYVKIRVPSNGKNYLRKFKASNTIRDVVAYAIHQDNDVFSMDPQSGTPKCSVKSFPERTVFEDWEEPLKTCFRHSRVQLVIEASP
eukprot:gb/GECG01004183.1/.p1 GENE.gb/GECG01004183.1/~~gb/GECG01004183.1/.p1  ORF type:complete len:458 (+),score=80.12 gb/GECG01004183.1/:1-1374(+)